MIGMRIARKGTIREPVMDDGAWTGETRQVVGIPPDRQEDVKRYVWARRTGDDGMA